MDKILHNANMIIYTEQDVNDAIDALSGRSYNEYIWWYSYATVKGDKLFINYKEVVPTNKVYLLLNQYYYDPLLTGNTETLYNRLSKKYIGISKRDVMNYLQSQEVWQLRKRPPIPKITRPIISLQPGQWFQIDLIDMRKYSDGGYNWILTCVDIFSKMLFTHELKRKTDDEVTMALEELLHQINDYFKQLPTVIQSDNGKEFTNESMDELLTKKKIRHVFSKSYTPQTNAKVERVNGTLKNLLFRILLHKGNKKWVSILRQCTDNYNSSVHHTTGYSPIEIVRQHRSKEERDKILLDNVRARVKSIAIISTKQAPLFKVGDYVRISRRSLPENKKNAFFKPVEYWSREIYEISGVIHPKEEWGQNRYLVNGTTYNGFELQRIADNYNIKEPINKDNDVIDLTVDDDEEEDHVNQQPKRGRGRPRKQVTTDNQSYTPITNQKSSRRRGRPKKNDTKSNQKVSPNETNDQQPKRGRGRPSKNPALSNKVDNQQPKRGRGRPRKYPLEIETSNLSNTP